MKLYQLFLTKNNCYTTGKPFTPKGIMVHSTGANNPNLKRYVAPDDGRLGVNTNGNHWNQATPDGRSVCVHAFIGKLADGSIATYQTLPWNIRGWHGGSGTKGSVNDTHIGFEICEDGLNDSEYFNAVYREAVELCAYLCGEYSLDPMADGVLICHSEGYLRGLASNHGDVIHWFPKHGKSMPDFRAAVKAAMNTAVGLSPAERIKDTLIKSGVSFDPAYWLPALSGEVPVNLDWLPIMIERVNDARLIKKITTDELRTLFSLLAGLGI